ncbi:hypothetical protein ERO13_D09G123933v2 [Gossypium hirsutum]|nr:hypothetical protein ERO13_D09G123933v2 [Gossypium hirsutum]
MDWICNIVPESSKFKSTERRKKIVDNSPQMYFYFTWTVYSPDLFPRHIRTSGCVFT